MQNHAVPRIHDVAPMSAPVTVVGDVHLTPTDPEVAEQFLVFLNEMESVGGHLVLLGDVFDWWVGGRQVNEPFEKDILDALRAVSAAGVTLAFQAGNRDYPFAGAPGLSIDIWPDVVRTNWGDRKVVLSHGDLLCTADRSYLRMRRFLRSRPAMAGVRLLPYGAATTCAEGLRNISRRAVPRKPKKHLGIDYGEAARWLEAYEADVLVLGHVHTGVHHRIDGARPGEVLVLSDWHAAPNAIRFDGDRIALERL